MKIYLAGRAAEQVVFGRVTNGAANDLEKATELARAMVFEYGMSERVGLADDACRQLRALGGDEAAPRPGAGAAHRRGLRGGDPPAAEAPRRARPDRAGAAREGDAATATSSTSCSAASSPSRARPRRSAPCACSQPTPSERIASARVEPHGIHHLGVAVDDLDEAVATYERLFGAELEHRETRRGAGRRGGVAARRLRPRRAARGRSATTRRSASSSPSAGPGMHHVAYEVDDVRRSSRRARRRGRRADRRARRAAGLFGLQVAFVHPDAVHGVLAEVVSALAERARPHRDRLRRRPDHGRARRAVRAPTSSSARSAPGGDGSFALDAEDGRYTVSLARVVYVKRFTREGRVGFSGP